MPRTEECGRCRGHGKILLDGGIRPCPRCDGSGQATVASKEETRHVLFHLGKPGGYDGGGFVRSLLRTIQQADETNVALLRRAYPGYVTAMVDWKTADLLDRLDEPDEGEDAATEPRPEGNS